jgi:hypothetical protein
MKSEPRHLVDYRRLAKRNLASLLRYKFLYEYGYDKGAVVAAAIVDDICATVRAYYRRDGDLEPGQLIYNAAAKEERGGRGKTMAKTRLVPVRLTLIAEEDLDAIRQHLPFTRRREIRVRRLAHEAARQGAALTEADLALLMGNCSDGTISGVICRLRQAGEWLPLRGYVADMGSFPTHKAAIVALYLQGLTTPDIASRTYHSKEAVDRYIRGFERVRLLAPKYAPEELPLLTGMSMPLIQQYLTLLEEHGLLNTRPRRGARRAASS